VYDAASHPALGQAPRDAFAFGLRNFGLRPQRLIAYDEAFLMWTLPTTRKGTAKVLPGRGVKINLILYWNEAFRDPQVERTQVEVRYDPFDAGTAHAFVLGRWVQCFSEYFSELHGRSEREIRAASLEIRARAAGHGRSAPVTARRLAEFLQSIETKEEGMLRGLRHREARSIIDSIISPAAPIAVPNLDPAGAVDGRVNQAVGAVLEPEDDALECYGEF
jgi:putative transposase